MSQPTLATAATALLLAAFAPAQPLPELSLSWNAETFETGDLAILTLTATPGDIPVLFANTVPGPSNLGKVGELGVGIDPNVIMVFLPQVPEDGTLELFCDLSCDTPPELLQMPFWTQIVTLDPGTYKPNGKSTTAVLDVTAGDCARCTQGAVPDPAVGTDIASGALSIPELGDDFLFMPGGQLVERKDGTARLTGIIARASDPLQAFAVDLQLDGRIKPGEPAPAGSPVLDLLPAAYKPAGGPVCPETWHYFDVLAGTLVGLDCFAGARLHVTPTGTAFQVGYGANGRNAVLGAWGDIGLVVLSPPVGGCPIPATLSDADIRLDLGGDCIECADPAADHAVTIPGFRDEMVFIDGGEFTEYENGTARLTGVVQSRDLLTESWIVNVTFGGKVSPGGSDHPPAGSPKLELDPAQYLPLGIVDTDVWHYYTATSGTLRGAGDMLGAVIGITATGPAFQVGLGANGKTTEYGGSGWLDLEVLSQPAIGTIPSQLGMGDVNIGVGCR